MRWIGPVVLGLVALACGGAADVPDTNCLEPETVAERVRFESMVLKGTVTGWDGATAQFRIEEIWRGPDLPEDVSIVAAEGRAFKEGERYLVFPTNNPPALADEPCSATARWDESFAQYRPDSARAPGAAPAEDADLPWEWAIAVAVLLGGYLATRTAINRRRHPEPEWNPHFRLDEEP